MSESLSDLMSRFPYNGLVEWIGVRPARGEGVQFVGDVKILANGLEGDRRVSANSRPGKRAVTLIQAEHIPLIASLSRYEHLTPELLRRNIVVSGINLRALRGQFFSIGEAVLKGTDDCAPCSKMEKLLGEGGYNAMRGHGGICAEVMTPGFVRCGDVVSV